MKRIPLKDTERYTIERFRQCKKTERHLAWLKSRKAGVGGSDMSTILGLNSFQTPYELWLEKTGRVEPEAISDKWAVIRGNALENELRKRFRANHPEMLVTDGTDKQFISREKPYLRASLDGILQGKDGSFGILEIKTATSESRHTTWLRSSSTRSSRDGRGATCTRPSETTSRWRYRSKPTWRIWTR